MKQLFLTIAMTLPLTVLAQPSSQVAWTADQINFVKAGNASNGEELAKTCAVCHGDRGISASPNFPSLAGQLPNYLYKQLQDYSNYDRQNPIMHGIAKGLSKQDAADLAAWFGSLPTAFRSKTSMVYEQAETLVNQGNSERILPPCEVCHGGQGQGQVVDIPALAGQNAAYTSTMLKAFKNGTRHNDIYSRMRLIAQSLSDEEIEELSFYYQNLAK